MSARVFYDGGCPFCTNYVQMLRLRDTVGQVDLVDLRASQSDRAELQAQGFDLDQGMVVDVDGRRLGGAEAVQTLALMSTPSGAFNRLNKAIFKIPALAALLYPVLRTGRWLTLFAMGRTGITDANETAGQPQEMFAFLFGLFSLFHVFNYTFSYGNFPPQPDLILVFTAAILVLLRPRSARMLMLLMLASLVSTIAQAPVQSNHTMLRSVVLIGYWLSFSWAALRGRPVSEVFSNFVLAGRGSLLVMYVFGVFHKINTDFLAPETSCAVRLWQDMPYPLNAVQGLWMDYVAIYGTFVVEGAIMLALIFARTRYIGLVCGICFHLLLGLSDYAAYVAFTTLSISMHVLFLSRAQALRIANSPEMQAVQARMRSPLYLTAFALFLGGGAIAMQAGNWSISNICLLPLVLPLCYLILRYGRDDADAPREGHSPAAWAVGITAAGIYFISATMPYFGLKTAQSINMFANLRLEAGVSNHLVFSNPPGPFRYLEDVAVLDDPGDNLVLMRYHAKGYAIVYYDLLSHLANDPGLTVSYTMNGQSFAGITAADRAAEIDATLHPAFLRKWFHFQPVQLQRPEPCTL